MPLNLESELKVDFEDYLDKTLSTKLAQQVEHLRELPDGEIETQNQEFRKIRLIIRKVLCPGQAIMSKKETKVTIIAQRRNEVIRVIQEKIDQRKVVIDFQALKGGLAKEVSAETGPRQTIEAYVRCALRLAGKENLIERLIDESSMPGTKLEDPDLVEARNGLCEPFGGRKFYTAFSRAFSAKNVTGNKKKMDTEQRRCDALSDKIKEEILGIQISEEAENDTGKNKARRRAGIDQLTNEEYDSGFSDRFRRLRNHREDDFDY